MALNFPSAPNTGDIHTVGSIIWKYNGKAWDSLYEPSAPAQVGLSNVDNTSDEDKPVSTAQQAALDALTKDDVGLDNVDNTSDINKPVSTAQQAAIDAAGGGGGSSFDQDLNTTDSPTFATLTTTNTIADDVYTVDLGASGTVTAGELTTNQINSPNSFISFQPSSFERLQITSSDMRPNSFGNYDLGRSSNTFNDCYLHGALNTVDVDATGTVTAGEVSTDTFQIASGGYAFNSGVTQVASFFPGSATIRGSIIPGVAGIYDIGTNGARWDDLWVERVDATGTVKKGVYTVATLPTGEAGMTCFVSDANATTRGSTVAGGGANFMPVYSDGTNWIIS